MVEVGPVVRKRARLPDNSETTSKPKFNSFKYWLTSSAGRTQVCKTAFLSVFGISDDRLRRIRQLLAEGKSPIDKRGLNRPGNAKSAELIILIENHIKSFPVHNAHYTSKEYLYLSANLNVKLMWKLFRSKYTNVSVTYGFYQKIFRENFDLKFGQPQVDTCCVCETLNVKIKSPTLNEGAKRAAVAELMIHKRRAKKFFKKIESVTKLCKEHEDIAGITMDYMQNLQLPEVPVQEAFYLRQLTYNVFNIHNLETNQAVFYTYDETVAKKGPNEVCSFIWNYIRTYVDPKIKHFYLFSDGCPGQNKNHCVIRLLLALVASGRFKTITQLFPIRGHSFLPCDRDFSVAKRKIRKTDRIYLPKQYTELIANSTSNNRFTVHMVENKNEILDFKSWWPNFYRKNVLSLETQGRKTARDKKQNFAISEFMEFFYCSGNIGVVKARTFIDGLMEHTFRLSEPNVIPNLPTELAYPTENPMISDKKMANLKQFEQYLPDDRVIQNFYHKLYEKPTYADKE